jgi:hypothetical protein
MGTITVYYLRPDAAVAFAVRELQRYLGRMTRHKLSIRRARAYNARRPGLWLGCFGDFGTAAAVGVDGEGQDAIFIQADASGGIIAGANPRSVLLAAYRYLTELGCRWVRPGRDGTSAVLAVRSTSSSSFT